MDSTDDEFCFVVNRKKKKQRLGVQDMRPSTLACNSSLIPVPEPFTSFR